jgi:branched-chain amino acid transport system substrate-binding protein
MGEAMVSQPARAVAVSLTVFALAGVMPASAEDVIKIGALLPLTGPASAIGNEDLHGMQYAVDEVGGMVAGKKIVLVIADDQNSPNTALTETRRLVENEKVIAVIGTLNSAESLALQPYITRAHVPYVSGGIASELTDPGRFQFTFREGVKSGQMEPPLVRFLKGRGLQRGVLFGSDYAAGHDAVRAVAASLKATGGTVVKEIFPRQGETDYAPYFSQVGDSGADFVYGYFFGGDVLRFVRQYRSFGFKVPLVLTSAAVGSGGVAQSLGQDVDGIFSIEPWVWTLQDPLSKKFVAAFTKKYGKSPEALAVGGYEEARVVLDALKALNGNVADGATLAAAMGKVEFPVPGGTYHYDASHNVVATMYLVQWSWTNGEAVPNVLATAHDIAEDGTVKP